MKRIVITIVVFVLYSCNIARNPIFILRLSSKDNCLTINRFVFENTEGSTVHFMKEIDGLQLIDSNETKEFKLTLSQENYSKILDLDLFRVRSVITQGVVVNNIEKGVLIRDTIIFKKPYKDTLFIEINLPKFKIQDEK